MFSLIITVISIALVAALAVASVYYGGPALSKGTAKATAATIVSQGQQISGATTLFSSDNAGLPADFDLADLTDALPDAYLTSVPAVPAAVGGAWEVSGDLLIINGAAPSSDVCLEIEKNRNSETETVPTASAGGQFGCYGTDDGAGNVSYDVYYAL